MTSEPAAAQSTSAQSAQPPAPPAPPATPSTSAAAPGASGKAKAAGGKPAKAASEGASAKGGAKAAKAAAADGAARAVDVSRLDLRVGLITKATKHPNADSLYVEDIDCGEEAPRVVVSGLVQHVPEAEMQNRLVVVVANLKPTNLKSVKSYAMVLAATGPDGKVRRFPCSKQGLLAFVLAACVLVRCCRRAGGACGPTGGQQTGGAGGGGGL